MKFDCWKESDSKENDSSVFKMSPWSKEGPHSEFRTNNTMNRKKAYASSDSVHSSLL